MSHQKILDSHIHLWPASASSASSHAWMTPASHPLATRHSIAEYRASTSASAIPPSAAVYIETDRYLPSPSPPISLPLLPPAEDSAAWQAVERTLETWAAEPLAELRFLQRIVEGAPKDEEDEEDEEDEGFTADDSSLLRAIVAWAPLHLAPPLLASYLRLAERAAGPQAWARVVGFRYLLQGIKSEEKMRGVALSEAWVANLVSLGEGRAGRGWAFDVGVDMRSGGVWQVEVAAEMVETVRERGGRVRFVMNHLCKPDLSQDPGAVHSNPLFQRWKSAQQRLAAQPGVYMKLSGGFSEFGGTAPSVSTVVEHLRPWVQVVFQEYGTERVMFGSDWPVCNVGGARGREGSWADWREAVERVLEERGVDGKGRERIWYGSAEEGYGLKGI